MKVKINKNQTCLCARKSKIFQFMQHILVAFVMAEVLDDPNYKFIFRFLNIFQIEEINYSFHL